MLARPEADAALRHWKNICSVAELVRISKLNRPTLSDLERLLKIELSIIKRDSKTQIIEKIQGRTWGKFVQAESTIGGAIPSFKTATEFDPEKSIYRAGRWLNPK